jgi:hypothetical protein
VTSRLHLSVLLLLALFPGAAWGDFAKPLVRMQQAGSDLGAAPTINVVSGGTCVRNSPLNRFDCTYTGGGGGTPGGSDKDVQFNSSGAFGGDDGFVWDNVNKRAGLKTTTPAVELDVNGSVAFRQKTVVCPTTPGTQPNDCLIDPTGAAEIHVTLNGAHIDGEVVFICAISGGVDGRLVTIVDDIDRAVAGHTVAYVALESDLCTYGAAADRIKMPNDVFSYSRGRDEAWVVQYSSSLSRWLPAQGLALHNLLDTRAHVDTTTHTPVFGDLIFGGTGTWSWLPGNITTTRKFLRSLGNGSINTSEIWDTLVPGDLGSGFVDATTDLSNALCDDSNNILKHVAGVWTCSTAAGTGTVTSVAGGVGVTNSPEPIVGSGTVDLDIFSLTTEAVPADGDWFPFVDVSVGTTPASQRKATLANLRTALGNPTGSGTATRLAFWNTATDLTSDAAAYWDNVNKRLAIGATTAPVTQVHVIGSGLQRVRATAFGADVSTSVSRFQVYKSRGTAPITAGAILSGDQMGGVDWLGDDGALGGTSSIAMLGSAAENFSGTNRGAVLDWLITPIGSGSAVQAMRLADDGSLLVGTTTKRAGTQLSVASAAQIPKVQGSDAAAGTLTLSSTSHATKGKVLFGNSNYDESTDRLALDTITAADVRLLILGTGTANDDPHIKLLGFGVNAVPQLDFFASRGTIPSTPGASANGDFLMELEGIGDEGTLNPVPSIVLRGIAAQNFSAGNRGAHLDFRMTAVGTGISAQVMRLAEDGSLLIGTQTQTAGVLLSVASGVRATGTVTVTSAASPQVSLLNASGGKSTLTDGAHAATLDYTLPSSQTAGVFKNTGSGTLSWALVAGTDFATQTANTVFAGPANGGAASPSFRALAPADIPTAYWMPLATLYGGLT